MIHPFVLEIKTQRQKHRARRVTVESADFCQGKAPALTVTQQMHQDNTWHGRGKEGEGGRGMICKGKSWT